MSRLRKAYVVLYLALLYLPISFIPLFAFHDSVYISFPWRGFTLDWFAGLFEAEGLLGALENSLIVAAIASVSSTVMATLAALATARLRFPGRQAISIALLAPIALPTVVIGVALLSAFSLSGVPLSLGTVAMAHCLFCTPFAYGVMLSQFRGLSGDLEQASMDLGEPPVRTFFRVTLPLAAPGILSSLMLTFTVSFDEFILAFFLSSNSPTLPVYMWSQMRFPDKLPLVLALATLVILFSIVAVVGSQLLRRQGRRRPATASQEG
ncbi:MAG: ABC transporter permease [Kiloniellales bacterium]